MIDKPTPMMISEDDGLKLLGLFTLSADYYSKSREAELAICRALIALGATRIDEHYAGSISDAIVEGASTYQFYNALEREGFVVGKPEPAP